MTRQLHDSVLRSIDIDWVEGEARLRFCHASGDLVIVVCSCSRMELPRREPWGPSHSVNRAEVGQLDNGRERLTIEMQSGDVLILEGSEIEGMDDWELAS